MHATLCYSEKCPVCRRIASTVAVLDRGRTMTLAPLETPKGDAIVHDVQGGEYVHAPHLVADDWFLYGKYPVGIAVTIMVLYSLLLGVWRTLIR